MIVGLAVSYVLPIMDFDKFQPKLFDSFQQNFIEYQNLITRSMYDKQLDTGKGTLLHMCDDVIQQEVLTASCYLGIEIASK